MTLAEAKDTSLLGQDHSVRVILYIEQYLLLKANETLDQKEIDQYADHVLKRVESIKKSFPDVATLSEYSKTNLLQILNVLQSRVQRPSGELFQRTNTIAEWLGASASVNAQQDTEHTSSSWAEFGKRMTDLWQSLQAGGGILRSSRARDDGEQSRVDVGENVGVSTEKEVVNPELNEETVHISIVERNGKKEIDIPESITDRVFSFGKLKGMDFVNTTNDAMIPITTQKAKDFIANSGIDDKILKGVHRLENEGSQRWKKAVEFDLAQDEVLVYIDTEIPETSAHITIERNQVDISSQAKCAETQLPIDGYTGRQKHVESPQAALCKVKDGDVIVLDYDQPDFQELAGQDYRHKNGDIQRVPLYRKTDPRTDGEFFLHATRSRRVYLRVEVLPDKKVKLITEKIVFPGITKADVVYAPDNNGYFKKVNNADQTSKQEGKIGEEVRQAVSIAEEPPKSEVAGQNFSEKPELDEKEQRIQAKMLEIHSMNPEERQKLLDDTFQDRRHPTYQNLVGRNNLRSDDYFLRELARQLLK